MKGIVNNPWATTVFNAIATEVAPIHKERQSVATSPAAIIVVYALLLARNGRLEVLGCVTFARRG